MKLSILTCFDVQKRKSNLVLVQSLSSRINPMFKEALFDYGTRGAFLQDEVRTMDYDYNHTQEEATERGHRGTRTHIHQEA